MFRLEILFFMQVVMGVLIAIVLRKLIHMKKQVENVVQEVENYIAFVTAEAQEETMEKEEETRKRYSVNKREDIDEAQTNLIQAVLGEYFL